MKFEDPVFLDLSKVKTPLFFLINVLGPIKVLSLEWIIDFKKKNHITVAVLVGHNFVWIN